MSGPGDINDPKQLTSVYKKNGSFDKQRKLLLNNFRKSETHANLLMKLKVLIDGKIKENPSILLKNKGKIAALIQGEIINEHLNESNKSKVGNSLLSIVDKDIQEKIIDSPEFHSLIRDELKDIRRKLQGVSDEDYKAQLESQKLEEEQQKLQNQQTHLEILLLLRSTPPLQWYPHQTQRMTSPTKSKSSCNTRHLTTRRLLIYVFVFIQSRKLTMESETQ
jgi:COMPASS component SHG1